MAHIERASSCLKRFRLYANSVAGCLQGTSRDELQGWQVAPFAEAVLRQPRSRPLLRAAARLLKCAGLTSPHYHAVSRLPVLACHQQLDRRLRARKAKQAASVA